MRGNIRQVKKHTKIHRGNTEREYSQILFEKAGVKEEWILCMLFPPNHVEILFYSKFDEEAKSAMQKLENITIFERQVKAIFCAEVMR